MDLTTPLMLLSPKSMFVGPNLYKALKPDRGKGEPVSLNPNQEKQTCWSQNRPTFYIKNTEVKEGIQLYTSKK